MRCENCGANIKWSVLKLELPCYASTKELYFCDYDCLDEWIDDYTNWEEIDSEIEHYD